MPCVLHTIPPISEFPIEPFNSSNAIIVEIGDVHKNHKTEYKKKSANESKINKSKNNLAYVNHLICYFKYERMNNWV